MHFYEFVLALILLYKDKQNLTISYAERNRSFGKNLKILTIIVPKHVRGKYYSNSLKQQISWN